MFVYIYIYIYIKVPINIIKKETTECLMQISPSWKLIKHAFLEMLCFNNDTKKNILKQL